MNRQCLKAKNTAYIVERAIETHERNPELPLARYDYRFDEGATVELTAKGYEVQIVEFCRECPIQPNEDDFSDDEEYQAEFAEYMEESQKLVEKYQKGEVKMYALIGTRGVTLSYLSLSATSSSSAPETPLLKLQNQDKRNAEIAIEKSIDDTKALVKSLDVTVGEFSMLEEQITYYAMMQHLRRENFTKVGLSKDVNYITDEHRFSVVQNLTEEVKTIIKRDFILSNLSDAQRGNYTAVMLNMYAEQHAPDKFEEIKAGHDEVYQKRHTRIEEKIKAIEKE